MFFEFAYLAFALIGLFFIFHLIRAAHSLAPWVPSHTGLVRQALAAIRARSPMTLVDLGCGDGRILFLASKEFGLEATGIEFSLLPYLIAKIRRILAKDNKVIIKFGNALHADISHYDVVYIYGLPGHLNEKLKPKFERELKPGAYVLSYNFSISGRNPELTFHDRWRTLRVYTF